MECGFDTGLNKMSEDGQCCRKHYMRKACNQVMLHNTSFARS